MNLTITENSVINLINTYANHKIQMEEYLIENDYDGDMLYDNADYQFHLACCETAEDWMRNIGISPASNFVQQIIEKERSRR